MAQGGLCSEQFLKLNSKESNWYLFFLSGTDPYTLKVGVLSRDLVILSLLKGDMAIFIILFLALILSLGDVET